ncbi:MAG: tRNA (N6-isopentenyl adenosine(37)-C2)-methylthiotransferase MiaB [Firmicutes bacterium]|nr:tRNA (N6-isopentenyl adenosine(37)-C2)-methylthiotransferase MiaB [Bacillota bacterium]
MNENDSRLLHNLLLSSGYQAADDIEEADIIIVNTCCVRHTAENRALGFIGSLKHIKETKPETVIVVCGCMTQQNGEAEWLMKRARHVSVIIGTFAASRLPQYIAAYRANGKPVIDVAENYDNENLSNLPALAGGPDLHYGFKAQVNIIYGCNNFCSYCIVPYVRGRERSRSPQEIEEELRFLCSRGVKEVQLLGQNVNSYGKDLAEKTDFAALLRRLNGVDSLRRLRFMTSHPRDFGDDLIETIAGLDKVCHQFHLPVQSGSDRILRLMNRGYDSGYYLDLLAKIRRVFPDAVITSDLLLGFPGETEEDFQQTLDFIKEARFDAAYTFIYSRRSGTPAAEMPQQIEDGVKKERLQRLMDVQNPISLRLNQKAVGEKQEVLVEGRSKNNPAYLSGRNYGNKIIVFPAASDATVQAGDMAWVQVTGAQTWNLSGELCR